MITNIFYQHRYSAWIALKTLFRKEVIRFMRIWTQTLLPSIVTMVLYFLIFGKFIGAQIHSIDGFSYIQYIAPGLIMMSIINNAYSNTSSSFFLAKFNRSIEEMLVSPMSSFIILVGYLSGGLLRSLLVGCLVTLVARFFTHLPIAHPGIVLMMAILTAAVCSLGGLINGILAKRFDDISFMPTFILTPLTYLGGIFYSIDQLPRLWQKLSPFNPIFEIISTFRYGFLGIIDIHIFLGFTLIVGLFFIIFFSAWWMLYQGTGIKT